MPEDKPSRVKAHPAYKPTRVKAHPAYKPTRVKAHPAYKPTRVTAHPAAAYKPTKSLKCACISPGLAYGILR